MGVSQKRRQEILKILNPIELERKYVLLGWSANQIAEETGVSTGCVIKALRTAGIQTRSIKEAKAQKETKLKSIKTCYERYGTSNPLGKGSPAFEKKQQTVLKRYGVDNVRKSPKIINQMLETKRVNGTLGNNNPAAISAAFQRRLQDPEWSTWYRNRVSEVAKKTSKNLTEEQKVARLSALRLGWQKWWVNLSEQERRSFLTKNKFVSKLEENFFVLAENTLQIKIQRQVIVPGYRYAYDGEVTGVRILLEVNGTFWHADPRVYGAEDILHFPDKQERTAEYIWKRDFRKQQAATNAGYTILTFWEKDIKEAPELELGRLQGVLNEYYNQVDSKD